MGLWDRITGGVSEVFAKQADDILAPHFYELLDAAQKDYDYSRHTPEAQSNTPFAIIGGAAFGSSWTTCENYAQRAKLLLEKCPVSKACIQMRAQGIQDIKLRVEGRTAKKLLDSPNARDKTLPAALASWETQVSVGGDLYLFWDKRVPGFPQVSSFRPDLVWNNVQKSRYEYVPGRLVGNDAIEFYFPYDRSGTCTGAFYGNGKAFEGEGGFIQHVFYYNPISPLSGAGAGDSAFRAVDIYLLCDDLIQRKFKSGGAKNGYIKAPNIQTDAEMARVKSQIEALNSGSDWNILAGGLDFEAAQLTFAELDLVNIRNEAAKAICTAFNVNPIQVGVGEGTHANSRSFDKVFYRNFIGPEAKWLIGQLEWGVRKFVDNNASIKVDETGIQHIQEDILESMTRISNAKIAKRNELRAMVGLPPIEGPEGDEIVGGEVPNGGTGLGQPEEKPGGETAFNADAGNRGDNNDGQ